MLFLNKYVWFYIKGIIIFIVCILFISPILIAENNSLLLIDDEEKTFESVVFENKIKYKINVPSYGKIAFTVTCAGEAGSKAKLKIKGAETGTVIENLSVGDAYTKSIYKELILSPGYHDVDLDTNGTVYFKTFKAEFLEASWDYADETIPGQIIEYTLEAMLAVSNPNQINVPVSDGSDVVVNSGTCNIYISPDDGITCSVFRAVLDSNQLGVAWNYDFTPTCGSVEFNALGYIAKNVFKTELCTEDYNFIDLVDDGSLQGRFVPVVSEQRTCNASDSGKDPDMLKIELSGPVDWGFINGEQGINQISLTVSGFLTVYDLENQFGLGPSFKMRVEGIAFLKAMSVAQETAPFDFSTEITTDCGQ
ncbi:hypothetical protein ACFL1T_04955 [Chlamydiota bacterium]